MQADHRAVGLDGCIVQPQQTCSPVRAVSQVLNGGGQEPFSRGWVDVVFVLGQILDAPGAEAGVARITPRIHERVVGKGDGRVVQSNLQGCVGVPVVDERVVAVGFVVRRGGPS